MARKIRYKKKKKLFFTAILRCFLCIFAAFAVLIVVCLFYFARDVPELDSLRTDIRNPSVIVQTCDGQIIGTYGDLFEELIKIEELPHFVPEAFTAIEDKRFLYHFGMDFIGFFRAMYQNYTSGKIVQGGSTITQQLAKNILIGEGIIKYYDRSISRKIKELVLAFWLERKFSKTQIMMMYLNRAYFGAGTYGIGAASKKYFNKSAKDLTIFEAAVLAGVLKAPSKYSPLSNFELAKDRARIVLIAMEEQGFIKNANNVIKKYGNSKFFEGNIQNGSMFFCDYIYEQARKILGDIEDDIVIVSTMDESFQKCAEKSIAGYMDENGETYKISQMALLCLDRDGAILAMVGGKSYTSTQFNRVTQAYRQIGSAFKPFVYGAALEYGYQLDDLLSDAPIEVAGWKPSNYKWKTFGKISILEGFTYSVNSISVRLAQSIGLSRVSKFSAKLGIGGVSTRDLSISIGTSSANLISVTSAYTSFIDGNSIWPHGILEIRTKNGDVLYRYEKQKTRKIIDKEVLNSIHIMLRAVIQRGTGRAANVSPHVFGKTGTNGDTDVWFIGFYDDKKNTFSVGIWGGNDSMKEKMIESSTGGRTAAKVAGLFISSVIKEKNEEKSIIEYPRKMRDIIDSIS